MSAKSSAKPAPLGRGLSALFGDTDASYSAPRGAQVNAVPSSSANTQTAAPPQNQGVRTLPITWLQPGRYQPRSVFDDVAIDELSLSIKERGVLQPLIIRPLAGKKDSYEIICGERRWRAAQQAGLHDVPVLIRDMSDREAMEIGLIENIQRKDLSPIEEAEGYRRLIEEFSHTHDNLAKIVGKSRPHIGNILRLLKLPDSVKDMITSGELSMGHARTVITSDNPEKLAHEIVKRGLNVRQAEALAQKETGGKFAKKNPHTKTVDPNILALERDLSRVLGLKVKVHDNRGMGHIDIHYTDLDQLEVVIKRLHG